MRMKFDYFFVLTWPGKMKGNGEDRKRERERISIEFNILEQMRWTEEKENHLPLYSICACICVCGCFFLWCCVFVCVQICRKSFNFFIISWEREWFFLSFYQNSTDSPHNTHTYTYTSIITLSHPQTASQPAIHSPKFPFIDQSTIYS